MPGGCEPGAPEAKPQWQCSACGRETAGDVLQQAAETQLTQQLLLELKPPRGLPKTPPEELVVLAADVRSKLGLECGRLAQ
ncbi:unnamed protein product [Effrenium voratum]|uniref:Uncharacterized protein n=1 Tax=Effrenium voratum TaxID=2562239 RepID=A0AA36MJ34_9DINO|nr:unnamed protein product [Effrenium voratum]